VRNTFSVYGLRLAADRAIPGLIPNAGDARPDVEVQLTCRQTGDGDAFPDAPGPAARRDAGHYGRPEAIALSWNGEAGYRIFYEDGTLFLIDRCGSRIRASWPETLTLEDAAVYLLGPVLAFVLRLRGMTCLHASAFVVDGGAVALMGPSGVGKSTTAAAFSGRGFPVLCDDTLTIEERQRDVMVHPGYPRLRLWPESTDILAHAGQTLPRLTPNWEKRYLELRGRDFLYAGEPMPLRAIYLLEGRGDHRAASRVEPASASSALLSLLANLRSDFFPDKESHRREFETIGRVSERIPVRRVVPGEGRESLAKLCAAILKDLRLVSAPSMPSSRSACTI
jgi:hypothetical protein